MHTNVTTGYVDFKKHNMGYINLKVRNMGQEPASYLTMLQGANPITATEKAKTALKTVPSGLRETSLRPMAEETAQLLSKLQAVHDEYQQKQLQLVGQLAVDRPLAFDNKARSGVKAQMILDEEENRSEHEYCLKRPRLEWIFCCDFSLWYYTYFVW